MSQPAAAPGPPLASSLETQERSAWRPIKDSNPFEATVERLAQAIRLGVVLPGGRLPNERELSERLQVSRGTLREAVKVLREAGFLISRPGRRGGNFVTDAAPSGQHQPRGDVAADTCESVRDLLTLRQALEPGAAMIAARRPLSSDDRAHLSEALRAARDHEPTVRRINDSRLHVAIAAATGSSSLTAAVADVQLRLERFLARIPVTRLNLEHADDQHRLIVEAILVGDAGRAHDVMEEHCIATALLIEGLLA